MGRKSKEYHKKVDMAKRIANQSQKVSKTYETFEIAFLRIVRMFSATIDRFMFNPRYSVLVSLLLALMLYMTINMNETTNLFNSSAMSSYTFNSVPIVVDYNSDKWEISGVPEDCEVVIVGDQTTIATQRSSSDYQVVANLNNLSAGTHIVNLTGDRFINGLDVNINPTNITVTIKEKVTQNFDISYDYINTDEMENIYALGEPDFEMTRVAVRASQEKLDSIAFIKALIDVSGVSADFTTQATLVAYDQSGNIVDADIRPETVQVDVKVTSPSKQVSIVVEPQGEVPNNMAIDSILMDHNSVVVYAPDSVLNVLDSVIVNFDASQLTSDQRLYKGINLPTGVRDLSVTRVNMDIKLGEAVTKVIEDVSIYYRNNVEGYRADFAQTTVDVEIKGTQSNIDKITAADIYVYVDFANLTVGEQEIPVQITPRNDLLVTMTPLTSSITATIIGADDETPQSDQETPQGDEN